MHIKEDKGRIWDAVTVQPAGLIYTAGLVRQSDKNLQEE